MKYEEFSSLFIKQNKWLKVYILVFTLTLIGVIYYLVTQRTYFIYQGGEIFEERLLSEEVCKRSFLSIVEANPHPFFVSTEIMAILKGKSFDVDVDKILYLKSSEENKCKIIVKGKEKIRAFLITLIKNESFPFFYKLNQIDEIKHKG
jgi:hypothetical protein